MLREAKMIIMRIMRFTELEVCLLLRNTFHPTLSGPIFVLSLPCISVSSVRLYYCICFRDLKQQKSNKCAVEMSEDIIINPWIPVFCSQYSLELHKCISAFIKNSTILLFFTSSCSFSSLYYNIRSVCFHQAVAIGSSESDLIDSKGFFMNVLSLLFARHSSDNCISNVCLFSVCTSTYKMWRTKLCQHLSFLSV